MSGIRPNWPRRNNRRTTSTFNTKLVAAQADLSIEPELNLPNSPPAAQSPYISLTSFTLRHRAGMESGATALQPINFYRTTAHASVSTPWKMRPKKFQPLEIFFQNKTGCIFSCSSYRLPDMSSQPSSQILEKITVSEFFAGIGLVRSGLEKAGWSVVFSNDIAEDKKELYVGNFQDSPSHFLKEDIHELDVIDRVLSEEGGRTSRGSIERMTSYVSLLNELKEMDALDFPAIESWWIQRVKEFFSSQPIKFRADVSKSLRQIIKELLDAALERQRECVGTMVVGAVLEHLVGAKLAIALPETNITNKSFSAADAPTQAKGDFLVGDTAIHVTVAPAEALARKCQNNLSEGIRPLVITTEAGVGGIRALAENADIADRVDVLEIGQFLTINMYEWIGFKNEDRSLSLEKLVSAYNQIIDECETDPSLKISLG
jgi:hypothetical protein